jgi:regulator of sigma E protease
MQGLLGILGTAFDLLTVILGFSLVIFIHELGHFLAARWAGIRVLAFALGFGPAAVSYRQGLGLRRGSSEAEYRAILAGEARTPRGIDSRAISPTEYRLNILPLGGYVKMLGQEDIDPAATSDAPDSYQMCKPWKRMVVISAGVIANVILAAFLFMFVFKVGLRTEPAKIGIVAPGVPASEAVALNAANLGITEPGLMPGDVVLKVDGKKPNSFSDIELAATMAPRNQPVRLVIQRDGVPDHLEFDVVPEVSPLTGLQQFGLEPARSATLFTGRTPDEDTQIRTRLDQLGLTGVQPGMTLKSVRVGDETRPARQAADFVLAAQRSNGSPIALTFAPTEKSGDKAADTTANPQEITHELTPRPRLQESLAAMPGGRDIVVEHLLGLTPVMRVADTAPRGAEQGLKAGDIFVRVGAIEFPSLTEGITEIRARKGKTIQVIVRRATNTTTDSAPPAAFEDIPLLVSVSREGTIGFAPDDTATLSTLLAMPPEKLRDIRAGSEPKPLPAASLITRPGTRILRINDAPVSTFADIRRELRSATQTQLAANSGATVTLHLELPLPPRDGIAATEDLPWNLSADDLRTLHALGWATPLPTGLFTPEQALLKADGPLHAVQLGVQETQRVMITTYVTFARLFQGTVKVEHLKGPVGIAHLGTLVASRGFIWLLFFLALISVNLAVINFLPLPIVDGGQFLFLVVEQIRGKPVPIGFQNAATLAGLVLIASMFLIVTFNDVMNLIGR